MKNKILILTLISILIYANGFTQISKEKSSKLKQNTSRTNSDHIGTWKLISQKITYKNGQIELLYSSTTFFKKSINTHKFYCDC